MTDKHSRKDKLPQGHVMVWCPLCEKEYRAKRDEHGCPSCIEAAFERHEEQKDALLSEERDDG